MMRNGEKIEPLDLEYKPRKVPDPIYIDEEIFNKTFAPKEIYENKPAVPFFEENSPLVINLFGGPGAGKSTTAAGIFHYLKLRNINCELVTEYAKDKTWEESFKTLENQLYVLGKQAHRQFRLKDKVEVMITDAPLLMSLYYGRGMPESFKQLVKDTVSCYDNINFVILRGGGREYNPNGRTQTEKEAQNIHASILDILKENEYPYRMVVGDTLAAKTIGYYVKRILISRNKLGFKDGRE